MMSCEYGQAIIRRLTEFPYLPSPLSVIDAALNIVEIKPNEIFADLGCGDGKVLIRAAQKFGAFCVGFEIDLALAKIARKNVKMAKLGHLIEIVNADIFTVELSKFDVIYVYPFPPIIPKLSEKIISECQKGTRILAHDHPLMGLRQVKNIQISEGEFHMHSLYLYVT
ncbi:MAG: methyltransferase domain-containing protein [Candidatus Bathyarchaeia archaeon]